MQPSSTAKECLQQKSAALQQLKLYRDHSAKRLGIGSTRLSSLRWSKAHTRGVSTVTKQGMEDLLLSICAPYLMVLEDCTINPHVFDIFQIEAASVSRVSHVSCKSDIAKVHCLG